MFSDWLEGRIVVGDVKEFKNKIRCVALSSSLVFTSENMSTASSSSSGYNSASSSSMLAMDSDSEEYSKELDEILARYERAASMEGIYLLHTVFPLLTNCMLIQCGLSPARSFTPAIIIQHMYKPLKLSFSIYEWNALMELLQQLVDNFFSAPIEGYPDEYDPVMHKCDDSIFVSTHVCENVKVLSIKKYDVTTELFAEDTKELLNMSKLVLSPRIIIVLDMIRSCLKSNTTDNETVIIREV
ncbi:hypothetical protein NQ315_014882 [Exocentrus adspersus]|uniref:Uncharacterized protein n=1 Tax=Exocentrus adspersus TaxID=1586481 RepID=A0AAV8VKX5_9CUCU|nr:hypothetical protein NQ315_014882 [Exocentrus adspersus]